MVSDRDVCATNDAELEEVRWELEASACCLHAEALLIASVCSGVGGQPIVLLRSQICTCEALPGMLACALRKSQY